MIAEIEQTKNKFKAMKELSETTISVLDKSERLLKIAIDLDRIYQDKLANDPVWIENFYTYFTEEERAKTETFFNELSNFLTNLGLK